LNKMKKTVGNLDRIVRVVLAAGAVAGAGVLGFTTGWGVLLLVVAAILLLTGTSAYCPAYSVLHVSTTGGDHGSRQDREIVGTGPTA